MYRITTLLVIGALVSACIGWVDESEVREEFTDVRTQIVTGKTSREEVRKRLGDAFVSDDKVEVFRALKGRDVVVIVPGWETQEVIVYALVVYDEKHIVQEIDWDIYEDGPAEVLGGDRRNWAWRSASLQADGYHFVSYETEAGSRREILLAPPDEPHEITPPVGNCALYLVLPGSIPGPSPLIPWMSMDFYLDGKLLVGSQVFSPWLEVPAFIRVLLPVGEHELKDSDGSMTRKISCESGSLVYLYPKPEWRATSEKSLFGNIKKELIGEFTVSDTPIDSLEDRRRILFYNHY